MLSFSFVVHLAVDVVLTCCSDDEGMCFALRDC